MILDVFWILGIIVALGILFAELGNKRIFGIFSGLLILIIGLGLLIEPLEITTSHNTIGTQNNTSINTTTSNIYQPIPTTSGISLSPILGIMFVLLGMAALWGYGVDLISGSSE